MNLVDHLIKLINNGAIIVPILSWLIAQILKMLIDLGMNKTFKLSRLVGDGGMPSGHSATVMSLATVIALNPSYGVGSVEFGIAMIFAVIVMHDALGVRRETGKQARMILSIVDVVSDYATETDTKIKDEKLKVLVGHTPLQVVCGALLGAVIAVVYTLIVNHVI